MIHRQLRLSRDAVHTALRHDGPQQRPFLLLCGHEIPPGERGEHRPDAPAPPVGHAGGQREIRLCLGADQVAPLHLPLDLAAQRAHAKLVAAVADADLYRVFRLHQQVGVGKQLVDPFSPEIMVMAVPALAGALDGDDMGGPALLQQTVAKGRAAPPGHAQHLRAGRILLTGGQQRGAGGLVGEHGDLFVQTAEHRRQIAGAHRAVRLPRAAGLLHREARKDEHLARLQQAPSKGGQIRPGHIPGQAPVARICLHDLPDPLKHCFHTLRPPLFYSFRIFSQYSTVRRKKEAPAAPDR